MLKINPNLRDILASTETAQILAEIAKKNNFNAEQKITQAKIVGLLVLGKINITELESRLKKHLSLDQQKSQEISQIIKEKIFLKTQSVLPKEKTIPEVKEGVASVSPDPNQLATNEVKKETQEIKGIQHKNLPKSIQAGFQIESFINNLNLELKAEQNQRLASVVLIYLKDVRDSRQTYSALTRELEQGGVGLNKDQAEEILKNLKKVKQEKDYFEERKNKFTTKIFKKQVMNTAGVLDDEKQEKSFDNKKDQEKSQTITQNNQPQEIRPMLEKTKEEIQQTVLPQKPTFKPAPVNMSKMVEDVRKPMREEQVSLETIEDLSKINLSFLRSKKDELKTKFNQFLETDEIKTEELFKKSPLYNLYQTIIQQAIRKGISINNVNLERKTTGEQWMTLEEIDQVAEMIKKP